MSQAVSLTLMRHPRTAAPPGLCYGRHDPGLAPGWERRLDALLPGLEGVSAVLASPAPRCARPAARLARALDLDLSLDPRLQELDFGRWEGRPWAEIPRAESDPWAEDPQHRAPPEGESFAQLRARVLPALAEAQANMLVVTHAGPIRAALIAWRGLDFAAAFARAIPYATPWSLKRGLPPGSSVLGCPSAATARSRS